MITVGSKSLALASLLLLLTAALRASGPAKPSHGVTYKHDEVPNVPWSIHVVKVDRSNPEFEVQSALARGNAFGLANLSEQLKALPRDAGKPVAGINGDFFKRKNPYLGDPKGLQIMRGELVSAPCEWTCMWVDADGQPHMTNVTSHFHVTWPSGDTTPFGLNEDRLRSTAVLYTSIVGPTTQTSGGRELILEANGTNVWLPLKPGVTYSARVREVRDAETARSVRKRWCCPWARTWLAALKA
jgi:hypothetical protein